MRYVFAPLTLLSSLLIGLVGYFTGAMGCDDGCVADPEHWTDDKNAAEWGNIVLFSGGIVLTALVFLGAVIACARNLSIGLLLFQGLLTLMLVRILESSGRFDWPGIVMFVPILLGAATLAGLQWDIRRAGSP
jgi:hypothetical protein